MQDDAGIFRDIVDAVPLRITVWRLEEAGPVLIHKNPAAAPGSDDAPGLASAFSHLLSQRSARLLEDAMRKVARSQQAQCFRELEPVDATLQTHWHELELLPLGGELVALLDHGDAAASRNMLAAIVANSDDAMIGKTLDGTVISWNQGAERIYGYTAQEMLGRSILTIVPKELHEEVAGFHERLQRGEKVIRHETTRVRKDGALRDITVTISPIRNAEGTIDGASTVARDVTEIKRLQHKLWQKEHRESLGTLAAGMAHDFNNLLVGILGSADLARNSVDQGRDVLRHLDRIGRLAVNAGELCQQILNYAGERLSPTELLDVSAVADAVAEQMVLELPLGVRLKKRLQPDLTVVSLNTAELEQVVLHLLRNACDALAGASHGLIELESGIVEGAQLDTEALEVSPPMLAERYVYLRVADNGPGLSQELRTHLFDPYYTKGKARAGLGLAMVLGAARNHSGGIEVLCRPGEGTRITVLFPVYPVEPETEAQVDWDSQLPILLLVDDQEDVRQVAREILVGAGFQVVTARDGLEALDIFRRHAREIAAVLLDMTMPQQGGSETLRGLLRVKPRARIILTSGLERERVLEQVEPDSVCGFLQKPYRASGLIFSVFRALASR